MSLLIIPSISVITTASEPNNRYKKGVPLLHCRNKGTQVKKAATYSPALHCSTIGAGGLNFSVRNGKRWDPAAIAT